MKNNQIKKILEELYSLEPELKKQEKNLIKIVKTIRKNKPDLKIDQSFVKQLKEKLVAEAGNASTPSYSWKNILESKWFLVPTSAGVGVATLLAVLFISFDFLEKEKNNSLTELAFKGDSENKIEKLTDNAFGALSLNKPAEEEKTLGVDGGGQLTREVTEAEEVSGRGAGDLNTGETSVPINDDQIAPQRINYKFVYQGKTITQDQEKMPVFKRTSGESLTQSFPFNPSNWGLNLINLGKFKNLEPRNLNLVEIKNKGYFLNFNFSDGSLSINKDWSSWQNPQRNCRTPECYDSYRLKPEDVPEEEKLISLANQFLDEYEVDKNFYGEPVVLNHWEKNYLLSSNKENFYMPEEINVVYPLKIDGQEVYGESGEPTGLYLSIDIREKKVSGLRNLYEPRFQSSDYKTITEEDKIISLAQKGGLNTPYQHKDPTETITINLDTPSLELIKVWNYNSEKGESSELFAPAFIFPVKNMSKESYYSPQNIVVPLVEELIKKERPYIGIPETR